MSRLKATINRNQANNQRSLMSYLNCGDPDISTTAELIKQCQRRGVDLIELGVPFPNSFTDGETVKASHQRALANNITFEDTTQLVAKLRREGCNIPIVLLVDFSHSVKPRGIDNIVEQASGCGADGLLIHGLPPLYTQSYLDVAKQYGMDTIFSLYPNSPASRIEATLANSRGFIYLVSQYGRTGSKIDFASPDINQFYSKVKGNTETPLLAGFGIKDAADLKSLFSHTDIDGAILGSSICSIIESHLSSRHSLFTAIDDFLISIVEQKAIKYIHGCAREGYGATPGTQQREQQRAS